MREALFLRHLPEQRGHIPQGDAVPQCRYARRRRGVQLTGQELELRQAVREARRAGYACVVLDGTLIPIDRVAADRPFYSGKHRKHGMNLQVIADHHRVLDPGRGPLVSRIKWS